MAPQRKRIVHVADAAALAERACDELLELARRSIADQGTFRIALAGGSTPKLLYARLADQAQRTEFARWQVFFGDERNVAPDHADSNFRMASESWLARGQVPAQNIHRIEGELDSFQAATRYEQQLVAAFGSRSVPRFDVALLGMGADGHTASLFPNSSALEESRAELASNEHRRVALEDDVRLGVESAAQRLAQARRAEELVRDRLLPAAGEQVASARTAYAAGRSSFPALIDALRELHEIELAEQQARAEIARRRAELDRALGRIPGLDW